MPPDAPASVPHAQTQLAQTQQAQTQPAEPPAAQPRIVQTPAQALWRVREYLRPYYGRLVFMILAALTGVSAEIAIPLLTKSVIDDAIQRANRGLLVELGVAAIAFGAIQCFLAFFRRWVSAGAIAGMEKAMRDD